MYPIGARYLYIHISVTKVLFANLWATFPEIQCQYTLLSITKSRIKTPLLPHDKTVTIPASRHHHPVLHPQPRTHSLIIHRNYHRSSYTSLLTTVVLFRRTDRMNVRRDLHLNRRGTVVNISTTANLLYQTKINNYYLPFCLTPRNFQRRKLGWESEVP